MVVMTQKKTDPGRVAVAIMARAQTRLEAAARLRAFAAALTRQAADLEAEQRQVDAAH
jgi:hypothetical protein